MAAQTTAYMDKDIIFIGCLIKCGAYHHLKGQKGINNLSDLMNESFSGQTFKCEEPHNNFVKVGYIQVGA